MLHEVEQSVDFFLDLLGAMSESNGRSGLGAAYLVRRAKYVRVVLDETTHSCQAGQRTACLVSVDDAKFGHSNGEFFVTTITRIKDQTVTRTIHGFEGPFFFLNV